MVIVNDFEFQLVSADDKTPLKEHNKCSNINIEVERDAEYYISVQRVKQGTKHLLFCVYRIDGEWLDCDVFRNNGTSAKLKGVLTISDGVLMCKALRFAKAPVITKDKDKYPRSKIPAADMGKIELEVYDVVDEVIEITGGGSRESLDVDDDLDDAAVFEHPAADFENPDFATADPICTIVQGNHYLKTFNLKKRKSSKKMVIKKNDRTAKVAKSNVTKTNVTLPRQGRQHLYTITLHYCVASSSRDNQWIQT